MYRYTSVWSCVFNYPDVIGFSKRKLPCQLVISILHPPPRLAAMIVHKVHTSARAAIYCSTPASSSSARVALRVRATARHPAFGAPALVTTTARPCCRNDGVVSGISTRVSTTRRSRERSGGTSFLGETGAYKSAGFGSVRMTSPF